MALPSSSSAFFRLLPVKPSKALPAYTNTRDDPKLQVSASLKEKMVAVLSVGVLTSSMVVPEVAEAASGVSPSLKNFLLSIAAGGVMVNIAYYISRDAQAYLFLL